MMTTVVTTLNKRSTEMDTQLLAATPLLSLMAEFKLSTTLITEMESSRMWPMKEFLHMALLSLLLLPIALLLPTQLSTLLPTQLPTQLSLATQLPMPLPIQFSMVKTIPHTIVIY